MRARYETPTQVPDVHSQLFEEVRDLHLRATTILGRQCEATPSYTADWYARELAGKNTETTIGSQQQAAYEIVLELFAVQKMDPAQEAVWWGTAVGRAVAWHIGWREEQVPRDVVSAVLRISKQRVHVLVSRKIGNGMAPYITRGELKAMLRERWERIAEEEGDLAA